MNEIELIRAQLDTERRHVNAVAQACTAPDTAPMELRAAAADYLLCVLGWFEARDQRLLELLDRRSDDARAHHALHAALAQPGASREALALHTDAAGVPVSWPAWAQFIQTRWHPRRAAIDALMAEITRPADWRTIAAIDADSILEERRRFERVRAACAPHACSSA